MRYPPSFFSPNLSSLQFESFAGRNSANKFLRTVSLDAAFCGACALPPLDAMMTATNTPAPLPHTSSRFMYVLRKFWNLRVGCEADLSRARPPVSPLRV